jgi:predicted DNA-binding transcriptional regulator AlpA
MQNSIFTSNEVLLLKALVSAIGNLDNISDLEQQQSNTCAYYTLTETAEICGIKPKTLYNRLSRNASRPFPLKPIKTHGRLQFLKSDVHAHVRNPDGREVK